MNSKRTDLEDYVNELLEEVERLQKHILTLWEEIDDLNKANIALEEKILKYEREQYKQIR